MSTIIPRPHLASQAQLPAPPLAELSAPPAPEELLSSSELPVPCLKHEGDSETVLHRMSPVRVRTLPEEHTVNTQNSHCYSEATRLKTWEMANAEPGTEGLLFSCVRKAPDSPWGSWSPWRRHRRRHSHVAWDIPLVTVWVPGFWFHTQPRSLLLPPPPL